MLSAKGQEGRAGCPRSQTQTVAASRQSAANFSNYGEECEKECGALPRRRYEGILALVLFFLLICNFCASAQPTPPPVSIFRSYVNDIPNEPLVTVTVSGASNVSCLTIEEDLPGLATAVSVSGDGVWLPSLGVIRWGPYFNTVATNVSYRLTGLAGNYPVNGGSWMDGEWYFSPGVTMVSVLPPAPGPVLSPPPQLPAPIFVPASGSAIPVDVLLGFGGWDFTLLDDTWAGGTRTNQNLPQQSAWFISGSSTNMSASTNALTFWNGTNAVVGLTYFTQNATTPVTLGVGDTLKATLNLVLTGVVAPNTGQGFRVGLFDFADSTLSPTRVAADGFNQLSQGNGVQGYSMSQVMGTGLETSTPLYVRVRTNLVSASLQGTTSDFSALSGSMVSNNFPGFTSGRPYVLTLTLNRTAANSIVFSASWLDTVTGGTLSDSGTDNAATNFRFDGLAIRSQTAASSATNITLSELRIDYTPQATNGEAVTTNAVIYYTLDGSLPTTNSPIYTNAIKLTSASTVRAVAFENGWMPSVAAVAYYGPQATPINAQVARSVNTSSPTAPVVSFTLVPGTNASCEAVMETLPSGLAAINMTAGGIYIASNNMVIWGPFFGTNTQSLSYQAVGQPGTYPVQATWSVDGVGAVAPATNIVVASVFSNGVPTAPSQVTAPFFTPASGSNVPVNVTITCATPGAAVYYTTDGTLPTQTSTLYSGPVHLAFASTVRAVAFTNGWTPSVASVAYYGPPPAAANAQVTRSVNTSFPGAPVVTFSIAPGTGASCVAVTETLPPGLAAASVSAGGNYIAGNNMIVWGPFFGTTPQVLSYVAVGQPGTYPVQAAWSVDGVGGGESETTNVVVASPFPTAPPQVAVPELTSTSGGILPANVTISCATPGAAIYYTTNGTLPTTNSTRYTGPLTFSTPTTLRVVAVEAGYVSSASAVGYYVVAPPTNNSLSLVRSILGNGTVLPSVTLTATPQGKVSCYAVTEMLVPGLTPSGLAADAVWNPTNNTIQWGPYMDGQARSLTYQLSGPSGNFPLAGQGSFDGNSATATGTPAAVLNPAYIAEPTNYESCTSEPISYAVDINPAPGIITVDTASGTVNWGDGTQSSVMLPVMTLQHLYSSSGTYTITLSASWTGYTATLAAEGNGTKTDTVEIYSSCGKPVIAAQPQPTNQVVLAGTTPEITVGVTSDYPLFYQWYFNQTNPIVSPTTSATLTLPYVTVSESGSYSVVVTNAYGSVTSSVATLTVVSNLVNGMARNANGSFTLNFAGLPNTESRIWATTNLTPPISWEAIFTNTATGAGGTLQFTDTNAINFPARFYLISTP
jgi:hypothetical protein